MEVSLFLLPDGRTLIAYAEELEAEPRVHLLCPQVISGKTKITFSPFCPYTSEEHFLLSSTSLLTVCEPSDKIRAAYETKFAKQVEAATQKSEPVVLTEDNIPSETDDEYEPDYVEEPLY